MTTGTDIVAQLQELQDMTARELKCRWAEVFGEEAPNGHRQVPDQAHRLAHPGERRGRHQRTCPASSRGTDQERRPAVDLGTPYLTPPTVPVRGGTTGSGLGQEGQTALHGDR